MKILFNVEYQTTFGESLVLNILPGEDGGKLSQHKMKLLMAVTGLWRLPRILSPVRLLTIITV